MTFIETKYLSYHSINANTNVGVDQSDTLWRVQTNTVIGLIIIQTDKLKRSS